MVGESPRVRVRAVPWVPAPGERVGRAMQGLPAYLRRARRLERVLERWEEAVGRRHDALRRVLDARRRAWDRRGGERERVALERAERRFATRWRRWVEYEMDAREVNAEIERYNRWFPLERQCALRHVSPAALEFRPVPPVTSADVLARFPPCAGGTGDGRRATL